MDVVTRLRIHGCLFLTVDDGSSPVFDLRDTGTNTRVEQLPILEMNILFCYESITVRRFDANLNGFAKVLAFASRHFLGTVPKTVTVTWQWTVVSAETLGFNGFRFALDEHQAELYSMC